MSERRLSNKQVVALILLAAVAGYVLGRLSTNLNIAFAPSAPHIDSSEFVRADPGPEPEDSPIVPTAGAPFLGPASAPVTIVEFSDFQCPYCSRATPILHKLLEQNDDDLKVVFRNLPLPMHADAGPAARAALAAHAQGQFWSFHDQLFANQRALDAQSLQGYADDIDLDMEAFGASLEDDLLAQQVATDAALARGLGINGTPSFMVNGILVTGAQPAEEFQRIIDSELEAAQELLDSGVPLSEIYRRRVEANRGPDDESGANDAIESEQPLDDAEAPDDRPSESAARPTPVAPTPNSEEPPPIPTGRAAVTVYVDYADGAGRSLGQTLERLKREYGQRVEVTVREVANLDDEISVSTVIALDEARGQGRFEEFHRLLLTTPETIDRARLVELAESSGLDTAAFNQSLDRPENRESARVERQALNELGVVVLPTVDIGTFRLVGNVPYEDLRVAINSAMEPE